MIDDIISQPAAGSGRSGAFMFWGSWRSDGLHRHWGQLPASESHGHRHRRRPTLLPIGWRWRATSCYGDVHCGNNPVQHVPGNDYWFSWLQSCHRYYRDFDWLSVSQVRCHDYVELLAELHLLPGFLSAHPRVRLLVIDSVAFVFRRLFDDLSQRTRLLNDLAQQLITMATRHKMAVVITNQMTTRLRGGQSQLVPALGESWGHAPAIRLLLHWVGPQRMAAIFKSPAHMDSTIQYQITSEGFRDANQCEQPQSKRPRRHTNQPAASQRDTSFWLVRVCQSIRGWAEFLSSVLKYKVNIFQ